MKLLLANIFIFSLLIISSQNLRANDQQIRAAVSNKPYSKDFIKRQIKLADSLSEINSAKALAILDNLLGNNISDKKLFNEIVEKKWWTLSWISRHEEAANFLESLIRQNKANDNPKIFIDLANEYTYLFDYSKAIANCFQAAMLSKELNDTIMLVRSNIKLITIYGELKMFKEAQAFFEENIIFCKLIKNDRFLIENYIEYGELLSAIDLNSSFVYFQKAMEIGDNNPEINSCGVSNYLIRYYINSNKLDSAKSLVNQYIRDCSFSNYQRDSNVYTLMAHIYSLEKKTDSTIYYNKKALETRTNGGNKRMIASSQLNLSGNYLVIKDIEKARTYLEMAEKIVLEINDQELLLTFYQNKLKYYEFINDFKNAYFYSSKVFQLNRKLNNSRTQDLLARIHASYEIQQKNIILEKELERTKARNRNVIYLFSISLFLIGVIYLIYLIRKKNYSYLKLSSRTDSIEKKLIISNQERLKLQSIFEYSVTGILILDNKGKVQYANRKSYEFIEPLENESLLNEVFINLFEEGFREQINDSFLNVYNDKQENQKCIVQVVSKKILYWLDLSFTSLLINEKEDYVLVTLIDITQEIINITKVEEQKKELQTLLNSVTESIMFVQIDGHIRALNNTAAHRLKSTSETLIGKNYFLYIPKAIRDKRKKMFEKVALSKKPLIEIEMRGKYNNLISMFPNINSKGEVDYISEFVQDLSEKRMAEEQIDNLKQRILRSQMNPHFIFNTLTSIQSYVIRHEADKASKYLNSFARLIRLILESSRHDYISLKNEIDILNYYLEIQKMRFSNNFAFIFELDKKLDIEKISIPPMLAQPFIENAIEHGIQHLNVSGELMIKFSKESKRLIIEVKDNGIGREAAEVLTRENLFATKSLSTKIIDDRIKALNKYSKDLISYSIIDLKDENNKAIGTQVLISIPLIYN